MSETTDKKLYIKTWKQELYNLRNIWCKIEHKKQLQIHITAIDKLIEEIADTKNLK